LACPYAPTVGSQASERLSLAEAKKAAVAMLDDGDKAESHEIAELNQLAAEEVDRVERDRQRRYWPVDLLGGERRGTKPVECELHAAILKTEIGFIGDQAANAEPLQGAARNQIDGRSRRFVFLVP
jgi:hypothetical protein